jgi:spore germination protein
MRPNKKLTAAILILSITVLQTGCWDQKIYEKIGFILQIGVESEENGKLKYTVGIPVVSPEAQERYEVLTTEITHMREGRDKVRQVSGKAVEGGKTQQVFFSEALASQGVEEFFEVFLRSAENSLLANVIVVEGSPHDLIKVSGQFRDKPRPTFYMNSLLDSAHKNSFAPETRIYDFSILTHSGTIDPITPLVSYNTKEIKIEGAALFSGDKMVGKVDTKEMGILNGLKGEKKDISYIYQGLYTDKSQEDLKRGSTILMKLKKRKVEMNIDGDVPVINIKLDFKGNLSEYSGELNLDVPEEKKKLEEAVADAIEKDSMMLLKYLTEVGADPIGFSEIARTKHNKYWKSVKWKDVYKGAAFNVEAKIKIEFYGAVTNV